MRIVLFYHSLISDWNHGNAHFLRGIASELLHRGHDVRLFEPRNGWSAVNQRAEANGTALKGFRAAYPNLKSTSYHLPTLDPDLALQEADLVIVHEWNEPELVRRIGEHRATRGGYRLLFHDTHHRAVTDPSAMGGYDLRHYDGVLAFGGVLREIYLRNGWTRRAWVWHEAADTRVFRPIVDQPTEGDLVWIGNWGDGERSEELMRFLLRPIAALKLGARIHGVRYPAEARAALAEAGVEYGGWLPNYRAPEVFARFKFTVHVPRRPYARALPGIPTIRVFEALACGTPLVCAPWEDAEHLFTPGEDYLVARDGAEMKAHMRLLLKDRAFSRQLAAHGHHTILSRHTCAHRVDELMNVVDELRQAKPAPGRRAGKRGTPSRAAVNGRSR